MSAAPARRAPLLLCASLLLAACGGDGGTDAPVPTSISVDPDQVTLEALGSTRQLTARVLDANGATIPDAEVTWTSSRESVATITTGGLVTAVGTGSATITARAGGVSDNAQVQVVTAAFACEPGDGTQVSLGLGQMMLVTDPSAFCLSFPAGSGQEYLVGVQSAGFSGSQSTGVRVRSSIGAAQAPEAAPVPVTAAARAGAGALPLAPAGADLDRRRVWRREHTRRLERDVEMLRPLLPHAPPRGGPRGVVVGSNLSVGDQIELRVRNPNTQCGPGSYTTVTAQLKWKGLRAWWFEDTDNPDPLTDANWQELSDFFDATVDPAAREYFGPPTDQDANGVAAILFSKEVNEGDEDEESTRIGFMNPCDLLPRSVLAASNEGEFFYHIASDPGGVHGEPITLDELIPLAALIIGHEYAHIIQFSRRIQANRDLMQTFMAEGQATLAEEVVGHRLLGNQPNQNYGVSVILSDDEPPGGGRTQGRDWYLGAFVDLFYYYGVDLDASTVDDRGPEECSWTSNSPPDPCKGRPLWYGITWLFLRWVSDHYGADFVGGEAELQRRIVDSNLGGLDLIENLTGEDLSTLLGHWAPMLYVDDRIEGLDPKLRLRSWNLQSLYTQIATTPPGLAELLRPHPRTRAFGNWEDAFTVRTPSFEWYLLTTGGAAAAVRATDDARQILPGYMQMFVVRTR